MVLPAGYYWSQHRQEPAWSNTVAIRFGDRLVVYGFGKVRKQRQVAHICSSCSALDGHMVVAQVALRNRTGLHNPGISYFVGNEITGYSEADSTSRRFLLYC